MGAGVTGEEREGLGFARNGCIFATLHIEDDMAGYVCWIGLG